MMMINWLRKRVQNFCNKRPPDFVIGPKDDPYMKRWWAIPRNKYFNIYLHHMLHDDDDRALHDHPWWSFSILLDGHLEEIYNENPPKGELKRRILTPGAKVFRSGRFAHRLIVLEPTWTIFITGPVFRKWGFWCPHSWRFWKDYSDPQNPGEIGRGCE